MSVEGYGQARVKRQDKLSPMIRLNEGASLTLEHIALDGGRVAPNSAAKGEGPNVSDEECTSILGEGCDMQNNRK